MRRALAHLQRCSISSSTRHASSTAETALRAAAAQQQQQRRADAKRREASKRWRAGGRLLDEFRRLERDKAATREETRLAVMVALKRNALQRPAHVAAAARALAARGDAAGAAWLVGSSPARGLVNNAAYAAALKACGKAGDRERAEKLLHEMREKGVEPDGLAYAGAIRAGVDGLLDAALDLKEDPTKVLALRAALRRMNYEEAAEVVRNSPLAEEADGVYVARRCASAGDVARTDAVASSWPSSQRCLAARVEARGNSGDVRGAVELAEAGEPIYPVVANAAMRALSLIGDGAGSMAFLRRLPETAIDRGTYLLAMRAHKCDADGCLALFRACEPATGEPVDEKLVAAALEALAEARRHDDAAELARDAARRGIGLDDRGAAALVRASRRSGDWQGALDLPVVGPLSAHAAVEACRAGADADRAVQIVEGLEAPSPALLADAAAACDDAHVEAAARIWRAGVQAGLYPTPARGDDVLTVDAHAMTAPLAVGAVVGALQECGDAQAVVVLTGDEDLKPQLRSRLEALGIELGATANAGALVVPGAEARGFCTSG
ncbi:unnamed protein product [Pelagomonas calceolata]|uniref:Pentacotripeptide-repeat region of PRORP domain-containing protein n=2 Tax=Pelagomonas calceolata TaxID=35677 RepID=A0A8J2X421_9STRA|nr:unnamed protein product [Pelagomonas calceolata]